MQPQSTISRDTVRLSPRGAAPGRRPPRRGLGAVAPHRSFDPAVLAQLECDAWVAYYRRDWLAFARSGITLSRRVFGLSWPATVRCSWLVLRATQLWAPSRDHRADRAQRTMERFYRTIRRRLGESWDPATAATARTALVAHPPREPASARPWADQALADALAGLYAHIYGVPQSAVLRAAEYRADAMRQSDQWIREGRRPDSPRLEAERSRSRTRMTRCCRRSGARPRPDLDKTSTKP